MKKDKPTKKEFEMKKRNNIKRDWKKIEDWQWYVSTLLIVRN